jgi:hypothetical protein
VGAVVGEGEVGPDVGFQAAGAHDAFEFPFAFADEAFGLAGVEDSDTEGVAGVAVGALVDDVGGSSRLSSVA